MNTICEIKNELINEPKRDIEIKNFYVYHLINPQTNLPFYVGKGFGNRMYDHEKFVLRNKHPNNNSHLFYKIRKILNTCGNIGYKKVIENIDETTALLEEAKEIKRIGRVNLCNLTDGGEGMSGYKCSIKVKRLMSKLHSGLNNPFYGKRHTQKTLQKISICSKGNSYRKGFHLSQKEKDNLSKIHKGKKFSESHKQKISDSLKKSIDQFTKNMCYIKTWDSISDASATLNIDKSSIVKCARNKIPSIGGYKWRYNV